MWTKKKRKKKEKDMQMYQYTYQTSESYTEYKPFVSDICFSNKKRR